MRSEQQFMIRVGSTDSTNQYGGAIVQVARYLVDH